MNTRIPIIALAICLFAILGAYAKPDKDDKAYTDKKVGEVASWVATVQKSVEHHETRIKALEISVKKDLEEQNKRISELEKKVDDLSKKLAALDKWSHEKWDKGGEELEKANKKTEKVDKKSSYSLWLLVPVTIVILAVVVFAFWPRKTVSPSAVAESSDRPKCPRCGWEHDPKDTVCKNPNCKTQF